MSAKVVGQVWELDLPHPEVFVLLAMADHAEHDGSHVFPSQSLIAWKTNYSVRQVRRIQERLKARKILIPSGHGRHGTNHFRIDLSLVKRKPDWYREDKMSAEDKMSSSKNLHTNKRLKNSADKLSSEDMTTEDNLSADKMSSEDISDIRADIWMSDKPSLEPKEEKTKDTPPPPSSKLGEDTFPESTEPTPKKKRGRQATPKHPFPEQFMLTAEMKAWAIENAPHVNIKHETKKFAAHWRGNGEWMSDWHACWEKWVLNAETWLIEKHPELSLSHERKAISHDEVEL